MYEQNNVVYANFWTRVGAIMMDAIVLIAVLAIIIPTIVLPLVNSIEGDIGSGAVMGLLFMYFFGIPIFGVLYRSIFESSKLQGTPGKAIVGIKVVNTNFERISFLKALYRNIVKIFSSLIFYVGFLVALGNPRGLTWHDSATGTFVVNK